MMTTAANLISIKLGKGDAEGAQQYFKQIVIVAFVLFSIVSVVIIISFNRLASFLTDIDTVLVTAQAVKPMMVMNIVPINMAAMLRGVIRSLGK